MNDKKNNESGIPAATGMSLQDIYYVLFRHKWKILCCFAAGLLAAGLLAAFKPPPYTSTAKLFIRYVEDTRLPEGIVNDKIILPDTRGEDILNSEVEILTSLDLVNEVVTAIGAQKILAQIGGGKDPAQAAIIVKKLISVEVPKHSDVLSIVLQHPDRTIAQPALAQLITSYLKKHGEIHRDLGVTDDFLTQQTTLLHGQLADTERELRQAKAKGGVVSLEEAKAATAARTEKIRDDLLSAEADRAEHEARLKGFAKPVAVSLESTKSAPAVPVEQVSQYKTLLLRLDVLSRKEQELLTQFTETSLPVTGIRQQKTEAEQLKKRVEAKYPALISLVIPSLRPDAPLAANSIDPAAEAVQVQAATAKIDFLNSQLVEIQAEQAKVAEMEPIIVELQRKRDLEESKYRYFSSSLEQARFDEVLGAGKLSNISVAQAPSPPFRDWNNFSKELALIVVGGLLAGIALAFLIEFYLDQTLKRPMEVETRLRLPLFLSIPNTSRNGRSSLIANGHEPPRLSAPNGQEQGNNGDTGIALWDTRHRLRPFFEALRDQLIVYFDVNNLTRHPKLIAVTGCAKGAGVSTIAAGLAATLSETGEGNVLLVDMNHGRKTTHPFYKGKPDCDLVEALENMDNALVRQHLYVVTEGMCGDNLPQALPKTFAHLMPRLKTSDYDYIIFDMPPVNQISVTAKLGRFMDVNLMVVESEKTSIDLVRQASSMVSGAKVNVGLVLNKKKTYVPSWLHQEL